MFVKFIRVNKITKRKPNFHTKFRKRKYENSFSISEEYPKNKLKKPNKLNLFILIIFKVFSTILNKIQKLYRNISR